MRAMYIWGLLQAGIPLTGPTKSMGALCGASIPGPNNQNAAESLSFAWPHHEAAIKEAYPYGRPPQPPRINPYRPRKAMVTQGHINQWVRLTKLESPLRPFEKKGRRKVPILSFWSQTDDGEPDITHNLTLTRSIRGQ